MKKKIDLDNDSPAIAQEKLEHFKKLFPEAMSEGKVDVEALRRSLGENVASNDERYNLNWAGKTEAFKALQTPTIATLAPCPEESVDFDKTGNVFIEGENLEVLKVLQKAYYGKIKMIYIDPPYNTGSDSFIYPDRFQESKEEYLKRIEEKDEEGYLLKESLFRKNSKENGHYHSNWLSMMYPRLFLARNLLREDGAICVSIGDEEVNNLRYLMNEIFGEENHRNTISLRRFDKNLSRQFMERGLVSLSVGFEYVLVYSKSPDFLMNPVFREASQERQVSGYWKGFWNSPSRPTMRYELLGVKPEAGQWKWKDDIAREAVTNYKEYVEKFSKKLSLEDYWGQTGKTKKFIRRQKDGEGQNLGIEHWIPPSSGILRTSNWVDIIASESLNYLKIPFDNPKNPELIKNLAVMCCDEEDVVLDFFAGSGSTAYAIFELNNDTGTPHKFIAVQLAEKTDKESEAFKAGFKTISDLSKGRMRRAIKKIKAEGPKPDIDLGFKVYKLKNSNFKIWRGDVVDSAEDLEMQMDLLKDPVKPEAQEQNLLWELLLKSGYDLNTKIAEQKVGKCRFYSVADGEMAVILSKVDEKCLQEIVKLKPQKVICLDNIFEANDQLKTNTALQMKDAGIEFRTI